MNHILIIDDDRKLRELIREYLENHGLQAETAENAEVAYKLINSHKYALLVVDVMMPGENGFDFTNRIKREFDIPVLMLTAKGEVEDRIKGLESGADDYLQKPFEPKELYLRITKLIERFHASPVSDDLGKIHGVVNFGDFEFNLESRLLSKNGERIFLSSSESDLLYIFCTHLNVPIDRFELAAKFHGISERSVDVQVTRLRKKIEDDPKEPKYIQTSRGKGYVFRV